MALEDLINELQGTQGFDLKYRSEGTDWPMPWQATLYSCKHEDYRQTAYGTTPYEAVRNLIQLLEAP